MPNPLGVAHTAKFAGTATTQMPNKNGIVMMSARDN